MELKVITFSDKADPLLRQICDLFGEEWSKFEPGMVFDKYHGNPDSIANTPHFICAFEGNRLAAANGYWPVCFRSKSVEYRGVQDCDSFVSRDFRGKGLFSVMIAHAEQVFASLGYDFIYGFPNGNSKRAYEKAGWMQIKRIHYMVRPIDASLVASRIRQKQFAKMVKPLLGSIRFLWKRRAAVLAARWERKGYSWTLKDGVDFSSGEDGEAPFGMRLSQAYVRWRFSRAKGDYQTIRVCGPRGEVGEVLLAHEAARGVIKVLALNAGNPSLRQAALGFAAHFAAGSGHNLFACAPEGPGLQRYYEDFRRAGFLSARLTSRLGAGTTTLVCRALREGIDMSTFNWHLQYSDYDTV